MAQKKGLMEKLSSMPKEKKALLLGVVSIPVIGLMVYYGMGLDQSKPEETNAPIVLDVPDGEMDKYDKSRLQTYKENSTGFGSGSLFDDLSEGSDDELDFDEVVGPNAGRYGPDGRRQYTAEELDPAIYSRSEILDIVTGKRTKEDVDREHAYRLANGNRNQYESSGQMTQAQRDSAYFARIEKAYQLASKYSAQETGETPPSPGAEQVVQSIAEPQEPEERKIDLAAPSTLPTDSFSDDGIITSLMDSGDSDVVHYAGTIHSKPVKATFLKNETLSNGQRVILRLMQDLMLSDGTTIPANTHITGTCTFSKRLKIDVKMLHYNGRMFPTDISVYDNDGTEGIYCPLVESGKKKKKQAAKTATDIVSGVGSLASTVLTGNPFVGRIAQSGLQAATSAINDDGTVSVNVTSGYEFYVFENVKEPNGKR